MTELTCEICGGCGRLTGLGSYADGRGAWVVIPCPVCQGTGVVQRAPEE